MKLASFKKEFLRSIIPIYNKEEADSFYYMLCEELLSIPKKSNMQTNIEINIAEIQALIFICIQNLSYKYVSKN